MVGNRVRGQRRIDFILRVPRSGVRERRQHITLPAIRTSAIAMIVIRIRRAFPGDTRRPNGGDDGVQRVQAGGREYILPSRRTLQNNLRESRLRAIIRIHIGLIALCLRVRRHPELLASILILEPARAQSRREQHRKHPRRRNHAPRIPRRQSSERVKLRAEHVVHPVRQARRARVRGRVVIGRRRMALRFLVNFF